MLRVGLWVLCANVSMGMSGAHAASEQPDCSCCYGCLKTLKTLKYIDQTSKLNYSRTHTIFCDTESWEGTEGLSVDF